MLFFKFSLSVALLLESNPNLFLSNSLSRILPSIPAIEPVTSPRSFTVTNSLVSASMKVSGLPPFNLIALCIHSCTACLLKLGLPNIPAIFLSNSTNNLRIICSLPAEYPMYITGNFIIERARIVLNTSYKSST